MDRDSVISTITKDGKSGNNANNANNNEAKATSFRYNQFTKSYATVINGEDVDANNTNFESSWYGNLTEILASNLKGLLVYGQSDESMRESLREATGM